MTAKIDYYDREQFEMMDVPWDKFNAMEPKLRAEGWFHCPSPGIDAVENDIGAYVYVRPRPGYVAPKDKILTCKDCHKTFTFTVDEQKFYKTKGFVEPKRCPECRKKAKSR